MMYVIATIMVLSGIFNIYMLTRSNFNSKRHLEARRKIVEQMLEHNKNNKNV